MYGTQAESVAAFGASSGPLDKAKIDAVAHLVRAKARKLCGRGGLRYAEPDDVEQQLWLHLAVKSKVYDSNRSPWAAFTSYILGTLSISIMRKRLAAKRNPLREACSLNADVTDKKGRKVERHRTVPDRRPSPNADLRQDVAQLRDALPSDNLRAALDAFMNGGSVSSIARELCISRPRAMALKEQITIAMEKAGMFAYVPRVQRQGAAAY